MSLRERPRRDPSKSSGQRTDFRHRDGPNFPLLLVLFKSLRLLNEQGRVGPQCLGARRRRPRQGGTLALPAGGGSDLIFTRRNEVRKCPISLKDQRNFRGFIRTRLSSDRRFALILGRVSRPPRRSASRSPKLFKLPPMQSLNDAAYWHGLCQSVMSALGSLSVRSGP